MLRPVNKVHKGMSSRFKLGVTVVAISVLVAAGVTGCGVRGSLEKPPEARTSDDPPRKPGEPAPHKPSILDPLIR